MRRLFSFLLVCALVAPPAVSAAATSGASAAYFGMLRWRSIGPFRGGRALAVAGVPGQPDHFYFGAVDGGVWESLDAGRTWNPIFDREDVASIGAIAVAPSDPRVVYVGTGEADMRSDIAYGDGVYKSTDGGRNWVHVGLSDTRQIGAIVVDPRNASVAYVAALGHPYGPNAERGVFKTTDGGKTWSKVLYENEDTGAISLAMQPGDPDVIYAALWQTRRPPWNVYPPSNGPGSGLYKTSDGGATWTRLTNGLPARVGHIGLTISAAAPRRVYAMVDAGPGLGGVYRSDDAGATWAHLDRAERIWQRGWYFSGITADPRDADVVYAMNTSTYKSTDGGKSFDVLIGDPTGPDFHALWIDPNDSSRMILCSDQGTIVTVDGGKTWSSWYNQPTAQFYHVATDNAFPYNAYGAQQDSGAAMAPSRGRYGTISNQDFRPLDVGGESGTLAPDPRHPGVVYGNSSDGSSTAVREIPATGWEQNLDPLLAYPETLWRGTWTLPIAFSPVDPTTLYVARQEIFRSRDGGLTWQTVSPDLSRSDEGAPPNLDAPTAADTNGIQRHGVVYAIAPSPLRAGLVWAGTDDGSIWVTQNAAASAARAVRWRNVTPSALAPWSKIGIIEASHFDPDVAYAAIDRHRVDDYRPYIYRTRDRGATWTSISNGIPNGSFVNVVREDPVRRGLLYAGTERGMYVSFDDGAAWESLQLNLPVTSIRDIAVHGDDLVVATHGRSLWVMDDVTPLRQMSEAIAAGGTYLFAPAPAYRIRPTNQEGTPLPVDEPQADNAPVGLYVDYYLAEVSHTPVVLDVLASDGSAVRHWSSANPPKPVDPKSISFLPRWLAQHPVPGAEAGAHRFVWDFHEKSADGPLLPPGYYTIRLGVNGRTYVRTARVLRDPRIAASDADLRAQYDFARQVIALRGAVAAARTKAEAISKGLTGTRASAYRRDVVGQELPENPDDSVGAYSHDLTSFLYLEGQLDNLEGAVESADAAPTPDMRVAYAKLDAIYRATLARAQAP